MEFEWDAAKAASNLSKHNVSFHEAQTVFGDPLATTILDPENSIGEERWLTAGVSSQGRILIVSHTNRSPKIRIIAARETTPRERRIYESGQ